MTKKSPEIDEYRLRERNLEVFQSSLCDRSRLEALLRKCNSEQDDSLPDQSHCLSVSYAMQRCLNLQYAYVEPRLGNCWRDKLKSKRRKLYGRDDNSHSKGGGFRGKRLQLEINPRILPLLSIIASIDSEVLPAMRPAHFPLKL